jgi:endoglucanase Acf2
MMRSAGEIRSDDSGLPVAGSGMPGLPGTVGGRLLSFGYAILLAAGLGMSGVAASAQGAELLGATRLAATPPAGQTSLRPRAAPYRSGPMLERAVPTNRWYSSIVYERWSDVLHAHPLTFRAAAAGLEIGLPTRQLVRVPGKQDEIQYPHVAAITVGAAAFEPADARLHDAGDWNLQIRMAAGAEHLDARLMHGAVYGQFELSSGPARLSLAAGGRFDRSMLATAAAGAPVVIVAAVQGRRWAIFAPAGSQIRDENELSVLLDLPAGRRFFSVAALPDDSPGTLALFARHAFAFVEQTRVEWRFDEAASRVQTRYRIETRAMDGGETVPLIALYPHQRDQRVGGVPEQPFRFASVRGSMSVIAAAQFETAIDWRGVLPLWPLAGEPAQSERLRSLLSGDLRRAPGLFGRMMGPGTYWTGKGLGALAQLMGSAEQVGEAEAAATLDALIRRRFAQWFDGAGNTRFVRDRDTGTILGYPEEYGSVAAMNDHHFHYGYWIMAAALLARRDPAWAAPSANGPMIEALIADIATQERNRRDFPFLRNFDPYAGHSWAGGDAIYFGHGNNQESSSEAVHAWAALILWGEETGNRALRDLGIYLYAHEASAIMYYWLDVGQQVLAPEFGKPLASMVFGGKYAYSTWWTEEPRQIQGINLLPITPASTYLSISPDYARRFTQGLQKARRDYDARGQSDGTPDDIWQDILAGFIALNDPQAGLKTWNPRGSVELGDTRTRTYHWLSTLAALGAPDRTVAADTPLYTVFRREGGERTYVVYLPRNVQSREIRFSDGMVLRAEPGRLTQARRP